MKTLALIALTVFTTACFGQSSSLCGSSPLMLDDPIVSTRNIEGILVRKENPNIRLDRYYTPIHISVALQRLDLVAGLLQLGADPNRFDETRLKDFPLRLAVECGNNTIVQELLTHGANPNAMNGIMTSSIITATLKGNSKVRDMLLKSGANINVQSSVGTPLTIAVENNDLEDLEALLSKGADPNFRSVTMGTPLDLAATLKNIGFMKVLLANGANPNLKENNSSAFDKLVGPSLYGPPTETEVLEGVKLLIAAGMSLSNKDEMVKKTKEKYPAVSKFILGAKTISGPAVASERDAEAVYMQSKVLAVIVETCSSTLPQKSEQYRKRLSDWQISNNTTISRGESEFTKKHDSSNTLGMQIQSLKDAISRLPLTQVQDRCDNALNEMFSS